MKKNILNLEKKLKKEGVAVIPTDTIYGISALALSKKSVRKVYKIKGRKKSKPLIILISSLEDLELFQIKIDLKIKKILENIWPGKVSVILSCNNKKFHYLHRGKKTLAFRLPKNKKILSLLRKIGPLVAPSANPEGQPPAETIAQAKKYFGKKIDIYIDGGEIKSSPSTLIEIKNKRVRILRQGEFKIKV